MLTAKFVLVIARVTDADAPAGFAPLAIGLFLNLVHLISGQYHGSPGRSLAVAVFVGGEWLKQLRLFQVASLAGGLTGGRKETVKNDAS